MCFWSHGQSFSGKVYETKDVVLWDSPSCHLCPHNTLNYFNIMTRATQVRPSQSFIFQETVIMSLNTFRLGYGARSTCPGDPDNWIIRILSRNPCGKTDQEIPSSPFFVREMRVNHRYLKKIQIAQVLLCAHYQCRLFQGHFFAVAINNTNETNTANSM